MKTMNHKLVSATLAVAGTSSLFAAGEKRQDPRPNIILIMVDDMGYSDLGSYGSEIETPNLDRLAEEGVRFREFYNNSISAPTRASLITGQYSHKAGIGYFDVNLGYPGYQGYLNRESLTFGEVLQTAGYSTFISGKWHVGKEPDQQPLQRGFDRFYGFLSGASNFYDIGEYGEAPLVTLVHNNDPVTLPPGDYLTNTITDHALNFIQENSDTGKPFFLYLPFNAPHWPLQAPAEDIAKYHGKFKEGWDILREKRIERLRQLGILLPGQTVSERDEEVPLWEYLNYDQKELWQRKMEVYAAMIDRVNQNVGRLLESLEELEQADNTLILFFSDNGAQGGFTPLHRKTPRNTGPIGTPGSWDYQEQPWAYLSVTLLRQYKDDFHEGGFCTSFVAWYLKKIPAGRLVKGTGHIIDVAPTLYELAGAKYPVEFKGIKTHSLPGRSLLPVLEGKREEVERPEPLFWERAGNRAVRQGN
ncbi:MAG: arylsulfatase [Bacteroides sp.]|nr:arylsulfatase [Bacteroides sp.]